MTPGTGTLASADASAPAADAPGAVLVVDDDLANRESLSRRLQRRGYEVATAVDGPDALRHIAEGKFEVILLDVMMPGMSGLEVLKRLREHHSATDLPVIMATAKDESGDIVAALEAGANDYVTKPLDFPVVAARVKTQLLLKRSVAQVLELEKRLQLRNAELEEANTQLRAAALQTQRELDAAAQVQVALLPPSAPTIPKLNCAWFFRACQELAGDALNVFTIDEEHVGFYVLDVSGHGVAASLLAVAATRILADAQDVAGASSDADSTVRPAEAARRLNRSLAWDQQPTPQFLTLFYAVFHVPSRRLTYVSAGHPPALRIGRDGSASRLDSTSMPIGVGEDFEEKTVQLAAGDRVYVYSDGLTETLDAARDQFGLPHVTDTLCGSLELPLAETLDRLLRQVDEWRAERPVTDDVSVVAVECEE
jgi:sigma-B regulation protein RsbU (phosphoserine phosphatase)